MPQTFHLQSHPFHAAAAVSLDPQTEPTFVKLFTLISAKQRTAWHIQNLAVVPQYAYTYYITTCVQHVGSRFKSKSTIQNLMYVATVVQVQISGLYIYMYIQYIGITRNVALFQSITFLRNASLFSHLFKTGEQKQQENAWPIEGLRVWFTIHGCVWSIHHWPWLRGLAHDDMTTLEVFGTAWSQHVSTCLNNLSHGLHIKSAAAKSCWVKRPTHEPPNVIQMFIVQISSA